MRTAACVPRGVAGTAASSFPGLIPRRVSAHPTSSPPHCHCVPGDCGILGHLSALTAAAPQLPGRGSSPWGPQEVASRLGPTILCPSLSPDPGRQSTELDRRVHVRPLRRQVTWVSIPAPSGAWRLPSPGHAACSVTWGGQQSLCPGILQETVPGSSGGAPGKSPLGTGGIGHPSC